VSELTKRSIEFDVKFKDFRFSDEVLMRGTFKPTPEFTKVQFQHYVDIKYDDLIPFFLIFHNKII